MYFFVFFFKIFFIGRARVEVKNKQKTQRDSMIHRQNEKYEKWLYNTILSNSVKFSQQCFVLTQLGHLNRMKKVFIYLFKFNKGTRVFSRTPVVSGRTERWKLKKKQYVCSALIKSMQIRLKFALIVHDILWKR